MSIQQHISGVAGDQPVDVFTFERFTVWVTATATGTLLVQLSPDGVVWSAGVALTVTAGSFVTITDQARQMRVHGATGGTFEVLGLYGHEGG